MIYDRSSYEPGCIEYADMGPHGTGRGLAMIKYLESLPATKKATSTKRSTDPYDASKARKCKVCNGTPRYVYKNIGGKRSVYMKCTYCGREAVEFKEKSHTDADIKAAQRRAFVDWNLINRKDSKA